MRFPKVLKEYFVVFERPPIPSLQNLPPYHKVKTIRVDDRNIAIQLWDTAGQLIFNQCKKYFLVKPAIISKPCSGQERFRSVTKTYFRRADGVPTLFIIILTTIHWQALLTVTIVASICPPTHTHAMHGVLSIFRHQVMLLYDVTSDRSFCAVRHWVNSIDVSQIFTLIWKFKNHSTNVFKDLTWNWAFVEILWNCIF